MADDNVPSIDYNEHKSTFDSFVAVTKWSTIACAVVLILMAVFLV